jgi:hypothetical protein
LNQQRAASGAAAAWYGVFIGHNKDDAVNVVKSVLSFNFYCGIGSKMLIRE